MNLFGYAPETTLSVAPVSRAPSLLSLYAGTLGALGLCSDPGPLLLLVFSLAQIGLLF